MTDLEELIQIKEELAIRAARTSFASYVLFQYSDYIMQPFHRIICEKLDAFAAGEIKNMMILLPPQHGKAIEDCTPVFTTSGWKTHGKLLPGDFVFSPDGKPVKVLAVTGSSLMECSRVNFSTGESIVASNNHEWEVYRDKDKRKPTKEGRQKLPRERFIVETKDLFSGYNRRSPAISVCEPIQLPEKELLIDPYILGSWLGDGSADVVAITSKDFEVIDIWKKYAAESGLNFITDKKGFTYVLKSANRHENKERRKLAELDVLKNKHIPKCYFLASREQRWELLRGLMDTDGFVAKDGQCEYCSTSKALALDVFRLISSLGLRTYIKTGDAKIYGRFISKKYRIFFTPNSNDKIFKIARKQRRVRNKTKKDRCHNFKFIKSVEPVGVRSAQCIQVEGSLYCVGNSFIATHNSELGSRLFPGYAFGRRPDLRIGLITYNDTFAKKIMRQIQRYMTTQEYSRIFPKTNLAGAKNIVAEFDNYVRNANEFEIVNNKGTMICVGRDGQITGLPIDMLLLDDLYKSREEAISPTVSEKIWTNYLEVFKTRLHNDSQQLIMNTRWDERDVAGRLLFEERADWEIVEFPALKTKKKNRYDHRKEGEALWKKKHSKKNILKIKATNAVTFNSLYQQDPKPDSKILIIGNYQEIDSFPDDIIDVPFWGIDWGFTNDPTAIVKCGIVGSNLYLDECFYQTGAGKSKDGASVWTDIIIEVFKKNKHIKGQEVFADHIRSEIAALRARGYMVFPALKGEGSINAGIEKLNSFNIFLTKRSVNAKREAANYMWQTFGEVILNVPVQNSFDHFWDAARMAVYTITSRNII